MTVEEAFAKKHSNITLVAKGKITKILADDIEGTPHQKFIMETHPGHTILVVNNVDRAYRVPVKIGDIVEVKGSYIWNKFGGMLHDTHHHEEPGMHEDGYITLVTS